MNVPKGALAIARAYQVNKEDYVRTLQDRIAGEKKSE